MVQFLKIAVSLVLLALLVQALDVTRVVEIFRAVKWWSILLAVTLELLLLALAAARWWVLLNFHGRDYRPTVLFAPYFVGIFLSHIFPSTLGGSVFRMYYIYRDMHDATIAASPIIAERLLGFVVMIVLVSVIVPFLSSGHGYVRILGNTLPWLLGLTLVGIATIRSRRAYEYIHLVLARRPFKIVSTLLRITEAIHTYLKRPWLVAGVVGISVGLQVMTASVYYLLGLGLGATVPLPDYLVIVPLVFICSTLPLSIGGLGVRETATVTLFIAAGMPPDQAGALAFLYLCVLLISSMPGLYYFLTIKRVKETYRGALKQPGV